MFAILKDVVEPLVRVFLAIAAVWVSSGSSSQPRLYAGLQTAVVSGVLCFLYLDTPFVLIGMEIAVVAAYFLSIVALFVGMAVGILLPVPLPGVCLGVSLALLVCALGSPGFKILAPVLAACGAFVSVKWRSAAPYMLTCASIVIGGALASCIVWAPMFPYLMDIGLGHSHQVVKGASIGGRVDIHPLMGIAWVIGSVVTIVCTCYRGGGAQLRALFRMFGGRDIVGVSQPHGSAKQKSGRPNQTLSHSSSSSSMLPDAYNMFDPAELPPRLGEYANMVYSACEDLGNFFGFQDSSVRNQAEHLLILLSNHRRYMTVLPLALQPPSPIHALHAKVFSNYMKWCKALGIAPNFSKMNPMCVSGPPAAVSRVVDLVLFFCIWGEGGNIKHMPECLWFLYHKMMESYVTGEGYTQTRSLYAGHFLDSVITPIFDELRKCMAAKGDHQDKKNYDDFNEFFWSRNCLQYCYSSAPEDLDAGQLAGVNGPLPGETLTPIADALHIAPKTFLEKRSWIRSMLALSRILEWHIATFYLLAVVAFALELVWGWVYSVQVASAVFWIFNALHLQWGLLEVWCVYPGIQLSGTAVCGSIFSLVARFLILVYQTLYLMWTFGPTSGTHFGIKADSNFWWWQYIWLSLLCMIPYFAESLLQLYPALTTRIYTSQNDYMQSFLNILFPLSRLYVGKEVHESFKHTINYMFFWGTMIVWKLYFSYIFEVYAMVLPTLQLTDDYLNFPDQSFLWLALLMLLRWSPQFVVYLIDMSIWYAAWQAFAGTARGFSDHLGDVRSMNDIRKNFVRAPEHFCKKMLSPDAGSRRGSSASFLETTASGNNINESSSLLGSDPHKLQSYVNRLLDVRIQKWVMFSAVWNEVIDHFRTEDIVSNRESDYLKFSRFDGFSQAVYLPVFQTAGVIESAIAELERPEEGSSVKDAQLFKPILDNVTMRTAVSEAWELGCFIFLKMLGPVHNDDVVAVTNMILKWTENGSLCEHVRMERMRSVTSQFIGMVTILEKGLPRRKPSAKPKSVTRAKQVNVPTDASAKSMPKRSVSVTSLMTLENDAGAPTPDVRRKRMSHFPTSKQGILMQRRKSDAAILDALRDQIREKFRAMAHAFKGLLKDTDSDDESKEVLDRMTFMLSMENGFLWDDAYATDQLDDMARNAMLCKVVTKVHGLVACFPDDVEPKSKEVRRRLTFFVNTLFMDIPNAPSIHDMFSWNVMTPFYSEDVTYSKKDLDTRTDALGVSTLLYLQTLYKADWNNFLERLGIQDEEKVWQKKYIEETRIWASLRAQTLTRTVSGMMYYEKALRLLANLERLDDETTNDLLGEKFGYIVACQVYGNMKKNQDPKADDIDQLMHRYPHLRVAYIDSVRINRAGASLFYSVLVKSDGRGHIQEVFRVRLAGNPVIGEGKPENQNHAIIFSRGEFLQTIDMNQEGYFEEALKMRNALQEFAKREGPLPTTILGLREHIFTGSVSSLANYMAMQEMSFVTLGQRVLANPLFIRLHYGHPDVFDKLFFMTRGGISKSSKGINLSEDIFAGYNNVLRGGQVGFKEYLQVGKGRDVGMSQIYKFEAKLSQGNAEQSLSRDVYRVAHRLDFCRLLSMYYGGIGHYFSNVLTVLTVYIVVYLMAILALYDLEIIGNRSITPMGTIQMLLGGLGLLQTIPLFATLGVERGWWTSTKEIFQVFVTGGPFHFMFHIQTKAHYFAQTIFVGGAKYRATGRGFVTQHTPFDEQYRFFASSHLYLGIELSAGLVLMGIFTVAKQYFGRTWSLWLASLSFLASPFWFNPLTFDWPVVASDYDKYIRWMRGSTGGSLKSWSIWWTEENNFYSTLRLSAKLFYVIKAALYLAMAEGIRRSELWASDTSLNKPFLSVSKLIIIIFVLLLLSRLYRMKENAFPYPIRRTIGIIISILIVAGVFLIFIEDTNCLRYALAAYYGVGALCLLGLLVGIRAVKHLYFVHDLVCGHILFIPLFVLGALQLPHHIQTWLLYHNALSTDVVVGDILRYARKNQETANAEEEDLVEQVSELRKLVQKQEELMISAGIARSGSFSDVRSVSSDAASNLVTPSSVNTDIQPQTATQPPGRVMSMSGLDVWGDMSGLGDGFGSVGTTAASSDSSYQRGIPPLPKGVEDFSFTQPDTMPPR